MKIVPESGKRQVKLSITPLIDVILLLLIFFMLTSHFVQEHGMNLQLPESETGVSNETSDLKIIVNEQGEIFVNENKVELSQISRILNDFSGKKEVFLEADESVPHGKVVNILDLVRKAGYEGLIIGTKQKSQ